MYDHNNVHPAPSMLANSELSCSDTYTINFSVNEFSVGNLTSVLLIFSQLHCDILTGHCLSIMKFTVS